MASWIQWHNLHHKGDLRRAYLLYGPDRIIAEDIIDKLKGRIDPDPSNYVSLSASEVKEDKLWAELNQYPANHTEKRLVVIRDCDSIKNWDFFHEWIMSRHIPQVHAIFVHNAHEIDTTTEHALRFIRSGRLINCGPLNEGDSVEYVKSLRDGLEQSVAEHLLSKTHGNLYDAANALNKAALWDGRVTEKIVDVLAENRPSTNFTNDLLRLKKDQAMRAAMHVPEEDYSMVVGQLDLRLDQMLRIGHMSRRGMKAKDIVIATQIPPFVVLESLDFCRHYDEVSAGSRLNALALVDSSLQDGARQGVLETITTLW